MTRENEVSVVFPCCSAEFSIGTDRPEGKKVAGWKRRQVAQRRQDDVDDELGRQRCHRDAGGEERAHGRVRGRVQRRRAADRHVVAVQARQLGVELGRVVGQALPWLQINR